MIIQSSPSPCIRDSNISFIQHHRHRILFSDVDSNAAGMAADRNVGSCCVNLVMESKKRF